MRGLAWHPPSCTKGVRSKALLLVVNASSRCDLLRLLVAKGPSRSQGKVVAAAELAVITCSSYRREHRANRTEKFGGS